MTFIYPSQIKSNQLTPLAKFYTERLSQSRLPRSEKLILHNFIEHVLCKQLLSPTGDILLDQVTLYNLLTFPYSYRHHLSTLIIENTVNWLYRPLFLIVRCFKRVLQISHVYLRLLSRLISLQPTPFIVFETVKASSLWTSGDFYYIPIEPFLSTSLFRPLKRDNISANLPESLELPSSKLFDLGLFDTLRSLDFSFSKSINTSTESAPLRILIFIIKCVFKSSTIVLIDNSQGLITQSKNLLQLSDLPSSICLNMQHGSGYYEFARDDYQFVESSPAYNYPLIDLLNGSCNRLSYPLNGTPYYIRGLPPNPILLLESYNPILRNVSSLSSSPLVNNSDHLHSLVVHLKDQCFTPLFRPHPRTDIDLTSPLIYDILISNQFKLPKKYKPISSNFKIVVLLGLGHSLIYHLISYKIPFVVFADPPQYLLTMHGQNFVNSLTESMLLLTYSQVTSLTDAYIDSFPDRLSSFLLKYDLTNFEHAFHSL